VKFHTFDMDVWVYGTRAVTMCDIMSCEQVEKGRSQCVASWPKVRGRRRRLMCDVMSYELKMKKLHFWHELECDRRRVLARYNVVSCELVGKIKHFWRGFTVWVYGNRVVPKCGTISCEQLEKRRQQWATSWAVSWQRKSYTFDLHVQILKEVYWQRVTSWAVNWWIKSHLWYGCLS
jgi:hypothetical protein